jgi:hypothetical protein
MTRRVVVPPRYRQGFGDWPLPTPCRVSAGGLFAHPFGGEPKTHRRCRQWSTPIPYWGLIFSNNGQQFSVFPAYIAKNPYGICIDHVADEEWAFIAGRILVQLSCSLPIMAMRYLTNLHFIDLFPAENSLEGLGCVAGAIHGTGELRRVMERRPSSAL